MRNGSIKTAAWPRFFCALYGGFLAGWLALAWVNLYFFSFCGMDAWCYAGPALTARAPFSLTMPFLGSFEGADKGWGLHWPGGPLLTSLFAPFLPHTPAAFVSIYLFYWLLLAIAVTAVAWRLTGSRWMALCACFLIAADRICFSNAWLERYELLDGALAMAVLLALTGENRPALRSTAIAVAFFLFPLMQPITTGLGLSWLVCIAAMTWALRRPWKQFLIAAGATAAGWAAFILYYSSRPWLWTILQVHARTNLAVAHRMAPPGIGRAIHRLLNIGNPTKSATIVYLAALCGVLYLLLAFWKSRRDWRQFLLREEVMLFASVGLLCCLFLAQFNYTDCYWAPAWPFGALIFCQMVWRLLRGAPGLRWLWLGGLAVVLLLHAVYLPARTYAWYKLGFINLRSTIRNFAASLPQSGHLFLPEVFWENYADGKRPILMNAVPADLGPVEQQKYADYLLPQIQSGDVLVIDLHQAHMTLIDPHQPGWKPIATCSVMYGGRVAGMQHGFELTAYQKE